MSYSKHETVKKQRKLVSKTQRRKRKVLVSLFKVILVALVTIVIACAGAGFGMMKGVLDNAPDINEISIVPKGFKTTLYDKDGNVEKELSTYGSNREYVYYEDIPEMYVNAFIAIEDERFWTHNGIDVKGILRAGVKGVASGNFDEGASTITQQLIKNHVFNVGMDETTFLDKLERKIQEQYLALELEKKYSKEEIVEYYLNTIYLGRGAHGIQAASELYFGKSMDELTISEIAVIAGITKNPSQFDPVIFPEENAYRREDVLDKMLELGYITDAQYQVAMADDVYERIRIEYDNQQASDSVYTYYEDAILNQLTKDLMEIYGCTEEQASMMIYTEGFSIYSVQDKEIQAICDAVINDDSYVYSASKVGLDYELTILDGDGYTEHNYMIGHVVNYFVDATGNDKYSPIYNTEEEARAAADTFREAMLIETDGTFIAEDFEVSPQPQFAFTIMDQKTGYVKAMVGGKGEKTSDLSFNRATDAPRQPGSTFKIVAAYLPLFDTGMGSLAKVYKDEPYYYKNGGMVHNWWGGSYRGYVNCREGIAQSMNVIAVKAITDATEEVAFDYLMKLGFTTLVDQEVGADGGIYSDITQSTALGGLTYGVTTHEMTAAYAAIANGGVYTKPVLYSKVVDYNGNVIIDNTTPTTHVAMKPTTAWQLIEGMKSVIRGGTGGAAWMTTGITCAGKTGTTSSSYDLWFCGMTPYYTASIWMGYDYNITLYDSSAHKYMWRDIMDQVAILEGHDPSVDFERPEGITYATVCKISGRYPTEKCPTIGDYCAVDSVPGGKCPGHTMIKLCKESKKIATEECKETIELVVELDPVTHKEILVGTGKTAEDYAFTKDGCDLHPVDKDKDKLTISTTCTEGGSITGTVKVAKGENISIYIAPYNGYTISDVVVDGQSVGVVSSYTFNNIQGNHTIHAVFTPTSSGSITPEPTTTQAPPPTTVAPEPTTTQAPPTSEVAPPPDTAAPTSDPATEATQPSSEG